MTEGLSIWDKLTRAVLILVVVGVVLGLCKWFQPVVEKNQRNRARLLELQQQKHEQEDIARKLDNALKSLQDPKTIECLAREKLNYAKPGENVIHFESTPQ